MPEIEKMHAADTPSASPAGTVFLRLTLNILDVLLLAGLLLLPLIWFFDPLVLHIGPMRATIHWDMDPIMAVLGLLAARLFVRARLRRKMPDAKGFADSRFFKNICLAIFPTFVVLFMLEVIAGWMGVERLPDAPIVITGQEAQDTIVEEVTHIVRDPELLYAFSPNTHWDGYRINSHGFRTWEFSAEKPADTIRVICLGDSCTAQGHPPYSDRLNALLKENPPTDQSWEAFNMGVFGYSVFQGYRQFLKYGHDYSPDVVTIYFGWNDHWTNTKTDPERLAIRVSPLAAASIQALRDKRIYAAIANRVRPPLSSSTPEGERVFRMPMPEYKKVLAALIDDIRTQHAVPLLLTAPRRTLTDALVKTGHATSPEEAEKLHDEYVAATRAVAAEKGVELLDLAERFSGPENDVLFMVDGIHFHEPGLQKIAEELAQKLREMAASGRIPAAGKP